MRDAILWSDATPASPGGPNQIHFNIPGPSTIAPASPIPPIKVATVIDGRAQPSTSVVLDGVNLDLPGSTAAGLDVEAGSSTVEGLVIDRFPGSAIVLAGLGGDVAFDDSIGTDSTGSTTLDPSGNPLGNGQDGVRVARSAWRSSGRSRPAT